MIPACCWKNVLFIDFQQLYLFTPNHFISSLCPLIYKFNNFYGHNLDQILCHWYGPVIGPTGHNDVSSKMGICFGNVKKFPNLEEIFGNFLQTP